MKISKIQILSVVIGILLVLWVRSCSMHNSEELLVQQKIEIIDSLKNEVVDAYKFKEKNLKIIEKKFQLEGLKNSYRFLYDNNSIIRKKVRPDDKMDEYLNKIEIIEKEIQKLNND